MNPPTFSYLNDCWLYPGAVFDVHEVVEEIGISRPLVVTDPLLVELGFLDATGLAGGKAGGVFDGTEANPTELSAAAGVVAYRDADCDGLVALGGGSAIDLAKMVALMVNHPGPVSQYAMINGGGPRITSAVPPLVAVPTTAGSGSEVGRAALLTTTDRGKLGFLSSHLLPRAAVLDPDLTIGLPPGLTAGTGMDAISHCVEAFLSRRDNPVADTLAREGFARGFRYLAAAFINGTDKEARSQMMLCSVLGGLAFQKGLGAMHSLSHPLGGLSGKELHHGTLNAVLLPHVLRFNQEAVPDRIDELAHRIQLSGRSELIDAFEELNRQIGIPEGLRNMDITKEELVALAPRAQADHCTVTNPRPLGVADCERLYEAAW